ncbi:hypothetical protein FZI85_07015 [Mycobacterium sp. CBMA293]|uniref:Ig-like domain-containing protein n=1 Tax=unclassified Mycolicibacterium TaxID=2636767 RepID=UPI0012DCB6A0|nr:MULTISPECIES: Ig-like domain-containing protein [unclassified Mycolicibacterium]MUL45320.1 hypothetical protein [Mycolicibacterium sp. CBMA 360]MUL56840.1 hypothetical protein [Mycolicibacterium sp. CBMA 335]MUL69879.1 hypothetical protein [Mycolicibacterium sp. CBMA 311]MUL91927.1 hypothetical protein [Mycolicibacterium sp. CBMA 230]MUM10783.1 hypothetical protein [Mycolicibacterium sp. CBMA 293]
MDTATTLNHVGRSASSGHARFIGRVGALAVALGIGAAMASGPAICLADDGKTTSSSDNASPSKAKQDKTGKKVKQPNSQKDSTTDSKQPTGDTDSTTKPKSGDATSTPRSDSESPSTDPAPTTKKPRRDQKRPSTTNTKSAAQTEPPASTVQQPTKKTKPTTPSPTSATTPTIPSASTTAPVTSASSPTSVPSVRPTAAVQINPLTAVPHSATAPTIGGNVITQMVSGLLGAVGLIPHAGTNPVAPAQTPVLFTVLGWIRRELTNTFFNKAPVINYNAASNSQTFGGVITGNLNATDANGNKLTYTVTSGPKNGLVSINQDGSFTYTPTPATAFSGGTDTFTVKVDDRPGNPFHINLLNLFAPDGGATTTQQIAVTVKPSSPLGTADQTALEQRAQQIVNTPQMQAAIDALKQAWLTHAQQQFGLVGGVDAANLALLDQAARAQALNAAEQVVNNDPNNPMVFAVDMPAHSWYGTTTQDGRFIYDNPDTIYRTIPVNSASTYVITGKYNSGVPIDGNFTVYADISDAQPIGTLNAKNITVNPDGTFTLTAGSNAALQGTPNYIYLPADAQQIFVRSTMSDWNTQSAPSLTVTRTSGPADTSPPTFDDMVAQAVSVIQNFATSAHNTALTIVTANLQTGQLKPPNTLTQPLQFPGTIGTQSQSLGYFQLANNQALVVTINPGNAGYFVVPVTNDWELSPDPVNQQTSLNNGTAIANPDGTYTLVISPTDTGVANWVSTGGLNQGTLYVRFQDFTTSSTTGPSIVSQQVVDLSQLSTVLPAGTEYVTEAQRQAQLTARQNGYNSRFSPGQTATGATSL